MHADGTGSQAVRRVQAGVLMPRLIVQPVSICVYLRVSACICVHLLKICVKYFFSTMLYQSPIQIDSPTAGFTLRDWVHRYNAAGVEGLRSRTGPGRPRFLTDARMEELRAIVLTGPNPERHTVIRWRCVDLCAEIVERWSVRVSEQTLGKWLRRLEMTRLQPRPYHPKKDPAAELAFKKTSAAW